MHPVFFGKPVVSKHAISAFGQALVAFAGALTLSVSMLCVFALAQATGLMSLSALDAQLVQLLSVPGRAPRLDAHSADGFRRVVLLDFDNDTLRWAKSRRPDDLQGWAPGQSTPRTLVAQAMKATRRCAAVVFVDFDLRERQLGSGDEQLVRELERIEPDATSGACAGLQSSGQAPTARPLAPVVIPRMLHFEGALRCAPLDMGHASEVARSARTIADSGGRGNVYFGHPYFHTDRLGYVQGICPEIHTTGPVSSVALRLPAAAEVAAALARAPGAGPAAQPAAAALRRVQFHVGQGDDALDISDVHAYRRVPALRVLRDDTQGLEALDGAIVIIGASHDGAEDVHRTALGDMSGAVVHANALLQIQLGRVVAVPYAWEVVVELLLAALLAAFHAWFFTYRCARDATGTRRRDALMRLKRFTLALILTLAAGATFYVFLAPNLLFAGASQYGILVPLVVVISEVVFEVLNKVRERAEAFVEQSLRAKAMHPETEGTS